MTIEKETIVAEAAEPVTIEAHSNEMATDVNVESAIDVAEGKETTHSKRSKRNRMTLDEITARFAACGRCSFFLAAYKVEQGTEQLEEALASSKAGWMRLPWNSEVRALVHKSYGVRIDISCYHYEGCCLECYRHFIYHSANGRYPADSFRMEL